jgi:hypothetical protein
MAYNRRTVLSGFLVAVLILGLLVGGVNQAAADNIPVVSTRGHFEESDAPFPFYFEPRLTPGNTATNYNVKGTIPGFNGGKCPLEMVIYVHGFQNTAAVAKQNFEIAQKSLQKNGYTHPIVGFSWDSDVSATGFLDFDDAKIIATKNGPKLAQFVIDYKMKCPNTKIRLISHSLGARVILNALKSLHENSQWTEGNCKIRSVHLTGAAVDNEEVSMNTGDGFGRYIQMEVDEFHNKFSTEDDVLEFAYPPEEGDTALGEGGAESGIPLPKNYKQEDVTNEISRDSDGDGIDDKTNRGDNHSGYVGVVNANGVLTDDGAMDRVVADWRVQDPPHVVTPPLAIGTRDCSVKVTLTQVQYGGANDIGDDWKYTVDVDGVVTEIAEHEVSKGSTDVLNKVVFDKKIKCPNVLDILNEAIEVDFTDANDFGVRYGKVNIACSTGTINFSQSVVVKEGSNSAIMIFFYEIKVTC